MKPHYLAPLFDPHKILVYLNDDDENREAQDLKASLAQGAFQGITQVIDTTSWLAAASSERSIPTARPDLALIAVGDAQVIAAFEHAANLRVRTAIVFNQAKSQLDELKRIALSRGVYLLGPGSSGLQRPQLHLSACLAGPMQSPGHVALVSQSGALTAALLDWAEANALKFSAIINTGKSADIGLPDLIDFLGQDSQTHSIVVYMEKLDDARRFLSALRTAARAKPVIILKAGRRASGLKAALTHSGALVGSDDIFDAALERSGAVRVDSFEQLFSAAKCLASRYRLIGNRLAVISNGGGPGVLAADHASLRGIEVPPLSDATMQKLLAAIPQAPSLSNPLDLGEQALTSDFLQAANLLAASDEVDGVLVVVAPKPGIDTEAIASTAIERLKHWNKPLIACWMGETRVRETRRNVSAAGLPLFSMPEAAIDGFANIATYYQNQQLLMQSAPPLNVGAKHQIADLTRAKALISEAVTAGRTLLTVAESLALLTAFHIPVIATIVARTVDEAIPGAKSLGYPLALKINSPDITHKSDIGGVKLDVRNEAELRIAFLGLLEAVERNAPQARFDGIVLQTMARQSHGREFFVGIVSDTIFGPVIAFGAGGTMIEVIRDRAVALPPLNTFLARRLMAQTRSATQLGPWRGLPPANQEALEQLLLRVSEMICELPELIELDINPVIVDEHLALVVDARAVIAPAIIPPAKSIGTKRQLAPYAHMAILPYPDALSRDIVTRGGVACHFRAIRPEDAEPLQTFARELSDKARYFRFLSAMRELPASLLARFTQIDYDREMAIIALIHAGTSQEEIVGVVRYIINPDGETAEFGLTVADQYQGQGIGSALMQYLGQIARDRQIKAIVGMVLGSNRDMLTLMSGLGYSVEDDPEDRTLKLVTLSL